MEKRKRIADFLINNSIYIMISILVIFVGVQYPLFFKNAPLDLLKRTAAYVIMALGMGCIILIGGIDLSAGRIMGLTSLIAASLLDNPEAPNRYFPGLTPPPIWTVFLLVIVIGVIIGCINGVFVEKFKLHPYIVTLCVQLMLYGTMLLYIGFGTNMYNNISHLIPEYKDFITNTVKIGDWAIPHFVWMSIFIIGLMWALWNRTSLGKKMRQYGENREAAKTLNINALAITVTVFAIAGGLYAFNGLIEAARVGGPGASAGSNAELDAIAACVMGGVSLKGGLGNVGGIVVGVVFLQLFSVCLQWLSISANMVYIIKGALILCAVTIDARKNYTGSGPAIWKW